MACLDNVFRYVYSSSLDERIQIKVGNLEGEIPKPTYEQLLNDPLLRFSGICSETVPSLKVILQVFNNGKPLGLAVNTSYKAFVKRISWNEWVTLPIQFSDLPRTAVLAMTVVDCAGSNGRTTVVGGTTISFFGKNGLFRQGMYDLRVWPNQAADGRLPTQTPGKTKASTSQQQMQRLAKLSKRHHNGQMPKVDWLDRLTFREIELINEKEKGAAKLMYMLVEFQSVQSGGESYSVVYFEPDGDQKYRFISKPKLVMVPDSEISQDNLVEKKHHRLSRSARSDVLDRELKPNATDRDNLHNMVHVNPPNYIPTSEEQDLIWKFRFHLSTDKQALVIFLRCINWQTPSEVHQALNLLKTWNAPDGCEALALLTPDFPQPELRRYAVERLQQSSDDELQLYMLQLVQALKYEDLDEFESHANRMLPAETVDVIQSIDEQLDSMQLSASKRSSRSTSVSGRSHGRPTDKNPMITSDASATSGKITDEPVLGHVMTASLYEQQCSLTDAIDDDDDDDKINANKPNNDDDDDDDNSQPPLIFSIGGVGSTSITSAASHDDDDDNDDDDRHHLMATSHMTASVRQPPTPSPIPQPPVALYTFLIDRAGRNPHLANYLYWYLSTECESNDEAVRKPDVRVQRMYEKMLKLLKRSLATGDAGQRQIKQMLDRQQLFVDELVRLVKMVANESGSRQRKLERFQQLLADRERFRITFAAFDPLPFPLDPSVMITGIRPEQTLLFKSAMMPAQLTFTTTTGVDYKAIFKFGDDLRQDQLVMQIIQLMDRMMRDENMDLKLSPYRVLATGIKHGFLQFVPSITLAEVCAVHGSICKFFAKCHATPERSVSVEMLDNYTRSLAGYCVITYLLGVGDRHLDNLLLTEEGKLFHIDFGYILGRDPKPMPPPMKLTKDMVEAMGGIDGSEHFRNFAKHIFTAYLYLRRQAKLTLNLFALMVDASIPDIALEPDKAVRKVEHHLRLDLTEEEAIMHLQRVIESSVSAVVPGMLDQMHKIAQYLRR